MKVLGIIPARYESQRIPNKPLFPLKGIPCVMHVYYRAIQSKALDKIIIAVDNRKIAEQLEKRNIEFLLTSPDHNNPTERMIEVKKYFPEYDLYVLINGDEALLQPSHIDKSINLLIDNPNYDVSLLLTNFNKANSNSDFKVVRNHKNEVMYISRADIPSNKQFSNTKFLKAYHLMTFTPRALDTYDLLPLCPLEELEQHEHLRFLYFGFKIITEVVESNSISLDEKSDVEYIENELENDQLFANYSIIFKNE